MKWLTLCLALLAFSGCSHSPSKPATVDLLAKPVEGKAVIVTYRTSIKPTNMAVENFIGEQSLGKLHNQEFNWIYVEPGEYSLTTRWPDAALIPTTDRALKVEAGQYYLVEMRGGVAVAVLFGSREFKPTTTSLKTGDYGQALKWLDNCCQLIKDEHNGGA